MKPLSLRAVANLPACNEARALIRSGRARTAEHKLRTIQASTPGEITSLGLLGSALLAQGKCAAAIVILESVLARASEFSPSGTDLAHARVDLARAYRVEGRAEQARDQLGRALKLAPTLDVAWLAYGDVLIDLYQYPDAKFAYERARLLDPHLTRIDQARAALGAKDRKTAEHIFRDILQKDASHVGALCGLAAVSLAAGIPQDAERLLRHALTQSAHLPMTWRGLSQALLDLGRLLEAEAAVRHLLKMEAENTQNWILLGTVCTRLMRQADALAAYQEAARLNPGQVRLRLSIGHLHKTLGHRRDSEQAYKECLTRDPNFGEAYWSLADLKNYVFSDSEIAVMQALLRDKSSDSDNFAYLHFALGRAFEHTTDYPAAFAHYALGNTLRRQAVPYSIATFEAKSARVRQFFNADYLAQQRGGNSDPAPIFIIGLPRSGSTLVEQILASHSSVEGTFELPNILTLVREFDRQGSQTDAYPESIARAPVQLLMQLGSRYLEETLPIRIGRPRFIDKMPNNFSHVGLIHCMLPNATIIDVRRHPMDACFSTYKQNFAEGQSFSYDLNDLGRYYSCYLELMNHWDQVLPGKILHLCYEDLVGDPQTHIRRLLQHCGLEFEPACLSFHETLRAVRTPSAEQVRQPLYTTSIGYWRHFEQDLEPLRQALGSSLARWA